MSTRPYIEAGDAAQTAVQPVPAVGQRWTCSTERGTRTVTVTRVWDDRFDRTAVAFEWRDDKPGQCGSALPLAVFLGTYKPEQQAANPAPALVLSNAERAFLAFALDLAADAMANDAIGFGPDDDAALASLRKLACNDIAPAADTAGGES